MMIDERPAESINFKTNKKTKKTHWDKNKIDQNTKTKQVKRHSSIMIKWRSSIKHKTAKIYNRLLSRRLQAERNKNTQNKKPKTMRTCKTKGNRRDN